MNSLLTYKALISKIIAIITAILIMFQNGQLHSTHMVTFYDSDGKTILAVVENVTENDYVSPPSAPEKTGKAFLGWSGNYVNVKQNENVYAVYNDAKNVFIVSTGKGKVGNCIKVLLSIDGFVNTCGFDLTIHYDDDLELIGFDDDLDLDIVVNMDSTEHKGYINYSSAVNKTKKQEIMELTFIIMDTSKKALAVSLEINSIKEIFSNRTCDAPYEIINGVIVMHNQGTGRY